MMKEIHEQPKAVKDTLNSVLKDGKLDIGLRKTSAVVLRKLRW